MVRLFCDKLAAHTYEDTLRVMRPLSFPIGGVKVVMGARGGKLILPKPPTYIIHSRRQQNGDAFNPSWRLFMLRFSEISQWVIDY